MCLNCGSGLGIAPEPQPISPPRMPSHLGKNIVIAIVLLVIAILAVGVLGYVVSQNSNSLGTTTVIPSGTTLQLQQSSYAYYEDMFQNSVKISGSFSTSYSVSLYIMTPSQFAELGSGSGLSQFVAMFSANKGQGSPTSINWNLQAGQYYFVIFNPWPIQSTFTTSDGIKAVS